MDVRAEILLIALGSAAVTLIPRVAPLVLLSRIALPDGLKTWLSYVPFAILGSLLSSELLLSGGRLAPLSGNPALVAIVPAIAIAWRYGSIIGAVLAGIAAMALMRALSA